MNSSAQEVALMSALLIAIGIKMLAKRPRPVETQAQLLEHYALRSFPSKSAIKHERL